MTNKTARKIVTEWRPDQRDSGRDNELLVKRLAHHLPEPDVWAAEPSARRVLTLTGRSLFVVQQEHELFFGRLIVTKDDQDTTVSSQTAQWASKAHGRANGASTFATSRGTSRTQAHHRSGDG